MAKAFPTASRRGSSNPSCRSVAVAAAPDWGWHCARRSSSCMGAASACTHGSATARSSTWPCRSDAALSYPALQTCPRTLLLNACTALVRACKPAPKKGMYREPSSVRARAQRRQNRCRFGIGLTIEAGRPVLHLKRRDDIARFRVQLTILRHLVALLRKLRLEPSYIRQLQRIQAPLPSNHGGIRPGQQPCVGQTLPGKQGTRIDLALRSDVAVPDDGTRL